MRFLKILKICVQSFIIHIKTLGFEGLVPNGMKIWILHEISVYIQWSKVMLDRFLQVLWPKFVRSVEVGMVVIRSANNFGIGMFSVRSVNNFEVDIFFLSRTTPAGIIKPRNTPAEINKRRNNSGYMLSKFLLCWVPEFPDTGYHF